MTCPKCNSDEWKSAEFMYKAGLTQVDTKSKTGGVGVGASTNGIGAGVGVGVSNATGTHQTILSTESSPPEEPVNNQGTIYWVTAIIVAMLVGAKSELFGWGILIGAIWLWTSSMKENIKKDYDEKMKEYVKNKSKWEITRVCQRCGQVYVPESNTVHSENIELETPRIENT